MASTLTPGAWLGIAPFAGNTLWPFVFFTYARPRAMRAVARRLATNVAESTDFEDAGTWRTDDDAPLAKTGAVLGVDLALVLIGTVGVAALVFVPAFIVGESGVLLPLESSMTGRALTLTVRTPNAMAQEDARTALRSRSTTAAPRTCVDAARWSMATARATATCTARRHGHADRALSARGVLRRVSSAPAAAAASNRRNVGHCA